MVQETVSRALDADLERMQERIDASEVVPWEVFETLEWEDEKVVEQANTMFMAMLNSAGHALKVEDSPELVMDSNALQEPGEEGVPVRTLGNERPVLGPHPAHAHHPTPRALTAHRSQLQGLSPDLPLLLNHLRRDAGGAQRRRVPSLQLCDAAASGVQGTGSGRLRTGAIERFLCCRG